METVFSIPSELSLPFISHFLGVSVFPVSHPKEHQKLQTFPNGTAKSWVFLWFPQLVCWRTSWDITDIRVHPFGIWSCYLVYQYMGLLTTNCWWTRTNNVSTTLLACRNSTFIGRFTRTPWLYVTFSRFVFLSFCSSPTNIYISNKKDKMTVNPCFFVDFGLCN